MSSVNPSLNSAIPTVEHILDLPPEALGHAFSFLDLENSISLQRVCRLFKALIDDDSSSFFSWCPEGCRRVIARDYLQTSTAVKSLLAYRQELENNLAAEEAPTERDALNAQIELLNDEIVKTAAGFSLDKIEKKRRARHQDGALKMSAYFMRALANASRDLNLKSCVRLKWQYKITHLFESARSFRPSSKRQYPVFPEFYEAVLSEAPAEIDGRILWIKISNTIQAIMGAVGSASVKFRETVYAFCADLSNNHRAIEIKENAGGVECSKLFTGNLRWTLCSDLIPSQEWSRESPSNKKFHLVNENAVLSGQFSADEQFKIHLMQLYRPAFKLTKKHSVLSYQEYSEQLNLLSSGITAVPLPAEQISLGNGSSRVIGIDKNIVLPMLPGWLIAPHATARLGTERKRLFHHSLHIRSLLGMVPHPVLFRRAIELDDLSLIYLLIAAHRIVSKQSPSKEDSALKTGAELHQLSWILLEALRLGKLDIVQSLLLADCPLGSFKNAGLLDLALAPHNRSDRTALNNIVKLLLNRGASCTQQTLADVGPELLEIFDPETQAQLQTLQARPFSQQALIAICRSESLELLEWAASQLPLLTSETLHAVLEIFQTAAEGDLLLSKLLSHSPNLVISKETIIRAINSFFSEKLMKILVSNSFKMPEYPYWEEILQKPILFQPAVLVLLKAFKKTRAKKPNTPPILQFKDHLSLLQAQPWRLMQHFCQTAVSKEILNELLEINNIADYSVDVMGQLQKLAATTKDQFIIHHLKKLFENGAPVDLLYLKEIIDIQVNDDGRVTSLIPTICSQASWVNSRSDVFKRAFHLHEFEFINDFLKAKKTELVQAEFYEIVFHLKSVLNDLEKIITAEPGNANYGTRTLDFSLNSILQFLLNDFPQFPLTKEYQEIFLKFFNSDILFRETLDREAGPLEQLSLGSVILRRSDFDLREIKQTFAALLSKYVITRLEEILQVNIRCFFEFKSDLLIDFFTLLDADLLAQNYLFKNSKISSFASIVFYASNSVKSFLVKYLNLLYNKNVRLDSVAIQQLAQDLHHCPLEIQEIGRKFLVQSTLAVPSNSPHSFLEPMAIDLMREESAPDRKRPAVEDPDGAPDWKRQHAIPPQLLVMPPTPQKQTAVWFNPLPQLPMMPSPGFALPPQQTFNSAPQVAPAEVLPENEGPSQIRPSMFDPGFNPLDYEEFNPDIYFNNDEE